MSSNDQNRTAACLATLLSAACLLFASNATAQPDEADDDYRTDPVDRVIPYDGLIQLDSAPLYGAYALRFALYEAADGGAALWEEEWSDEPIGEDPGRDCVLDDSCLVGFYGGRFSVRLGQYVELEDTFVAYGQLYLGISIRDDAGAWWDLNHRQRLIMAPLTVWSANLTITGEMTAESIVAEDAIVNASIVSTTNNNVTIANDMMIQAGSLLCIPGPCEATSTSGHITIDTAGTVDRDAVALYSDTVEVIGNLVTQTSVTAADIGWVDSVGNAVDWIVTASPSNPIHFNSSGNRNSTIFRDFFEVTGGMTVNGTSSFKNITFEDQGITIDSAEPLFIAHWQDLGQTNNPIDLGITYADWHCWVVGQSFYDGNIYTANYPGHVFRLSESSGSYHAVLDFPSDGGAATREVGVFCVQRGLL